MFVWMNCSVEDFFLGGGRSGIFWGYVRETSGGISALRITSLHRLWIVLHPD